MTPLPVRHNLGGSKKVKHTTYLTLPAMKTIAFLTDFSNAAKAAMPYAVQLARAVQAQLVLLHVHMTPALYGGLTGGYGASGWTDPVLTTPETLVTYEDTLPLVEEQLQSQVQDLQAVAGADVPVRGELLTGMGMDAVPGYLAEHAVGLVVMGTRGASSWVERWVNTNANSVMNQAPCPVLAVPDNYTFQGFSPVVYATDPAHETVWHAQQLKALKQLLGADVTVLHVQQNEDPQAQARWEAFCQEWSQIEPGFRFVRVLSETVVDRLETYVQENNAQLLVVAKQHYSFLEGLFHSSATERLTQDNLVPILSFPALSEDTTAADAMPMTVFS